MHTWFAIGGHSWKVNWCAGAEFLFVYVFLCLGGKGNYTCLSVACRNSCGFQRMLEPPSIPTSEPS